MPEGVSAMRGLALPSQPFSDTPFVVTAPRRPRPRSRRTPALRRTCPTPRSRGSSSQARPRFTRHAHRSLPGPPGSAARSRRLLARLRGSLGIEPHHLPHHLPRRRTPGRRTQAPPLSVRGVHHARKARARRRMPCAAPATPRRARPRTRGHAGHDLHEGLGAAHGHVAVGRALPRRRGKRLFHERGAEARAPEAAVVGGAARALAAAGRPRGQKRLVAPAAGERRGSVCAPSTTSARTPAAHQPLAQHEQRGRTHAAAHEERAGARRGRAPIRAPPAR